MAEQREERGSRLLPSKATGLLYGLGLGGFLDGIVLHQILQWHHMVSHVEDYPMTTVAGLEVNTLADGFFHVATWFLVLAGSITAIRACAKVVLPPVGLSTSAWCWRAGASSIWWR